jgi:hypothetical protein
MRYNEKMLPVPAHHRTTAEHLFRAGHELFHCILSDIMNKLFSTLLRFVLALCVLVAAVAHAGQNMLPEGVNEKDFSAWLVPNKKTDDSVRIVQVRKWNKNQYVIMACSEKYNDDTYCDEDGCSDTFDVYIGIIGYNGQNYTFDYRTDAPISINPNDYSTGSFTESYSLKLDLAPYRVNEKITAIGFRLEFFVGFASGGAANKHLWLLMPHEGRLQEILVLNVESGEIIAGDWNPDGSRNHSGTWDNTTLHVLETKTNGFYDYLVKTTHSDTEGTEAKKSTTSTRFIWSQEKNRYVPERPVKRENQRHETEIFIHVGLSDSDGNPFDCGRKEPVVQPIPDWRTH